MPQITDMENLREAFLRASKGKRGKRAVIDFEENLESRLGEIRTFPFFRNVECMPLVATGYENKLTGEKCMHFSLQMTQFFSFNPNPYTLFHLIPFPF